MLTENSFHHHNDSSIASQHRRHYIPYQHSSYSSEKSIQQHAELQLPKFDLHHAVRINDVSGIIYLHNSLRERPIIDDSCLLNSYGHTPLYTAIASGRLVMVDLLLHLGHNPYCVSVAYESALNVAISYGRLDILEYLLKRNFPVDYVGFENKTPLERAVECNQGLAVVILLKYGANWRRYDEQRKTGDRSLIEWALANEHPQVLGVLIDLYGDDEYVFNQIGMM